MPNHCQNTLRITGPKEDLERFQEESKGRKPDYAEESPGERKEIRESILHRLNFHSLVPIPEESIQAGYNGTLNPDVSSGYMAEIEEWGVKWGAYAVQENDREKTTELEYVFDTAWSPPIIWLDKVAPMFPTLRFDMRYEEPGVGFIGHYVLEGETVLLDEHREYTYDDAVKTFGEEEANAMYELN